ncbi:MAG: hypothetical protein HHJ09_13905 [Glaciimonas sp.]|nr:hypothetical protein [Glaciimonas sp.]
MSKLFNFKNWLTLDESANHLTTRLKEPVTQVDILQLVLDGHLTLSVNFVNTVYARKGKIVPHNDDATGFLIPINGHEIFSFEDKIYQISGIYDLPMIGGEIYDCEHKIQKLTDGPLVLKSEARGAFVKSHDSEIYYQIVYYVLEENERFDFYHAQKKIEKWSWHGRLFDDVNIHSFIENRGKFCSAIPRNDIFVVHRDALKKCEQLINGAQESADQDDKPLSTRERNTLLKIIGALCKAQELDLSKPYKAAEIIRNNLELVGNSMSIETIAAKLEQAKKS